MGGPEDFLAFGDMVIRWDPPGCQIEMLRTPRLVIQCRRVLSSLEHCNNIIPEFLRPEPKVAETKPESTQPTSNTVQSLQFSFHTVAAGGYNGLLASNHEYSKNPELVFDLHEKMKQSGTRPNVTTYNYLIEAYMKRRDFEEAYRCVYEMEALGMEPNMMTFEVLIHGMAKVKGMGTAVAELFELMEVKYSMKPSIRCWIDRICACTYKRSQPKAIDLYEAMLEQLPATKKYTLVQCDILRVAISRSCWTLAARVMEQVRFSHRSASTLTSNDNISNDKAIIPLSELRKMWDIVDLFRDELSVPVIRVLARELDAAGILEQESYLRILFFTARPLVIAPDLAELAMDGLIRALKNGQKGKVPIPHNYIKAFLSSMKKGDGEMEETAVITPSMQAKIDLFTRNGGGK